MRIAAVIMLVCSALANALLFGKYVYSSLLLAIAIFNFVVVVREHREPTRGRSSADSSGQ